MTKSIREVFEAHCQNLVIDKKFINRIGKYRSDFVNKNRDHIDFFGGHLLGVHVVRFLDSDKNRWFSEILEVDELPLQSDLLALPTVNADWNVSSDTMNLSCAWVSHAIFTSRLLNDVQKHQGLINVMLVLQYKYLTSRLFRHFKYLADRGTAEATYAQLSKKFAIKRYGNWQAVLDARSEEIIAEKNDDGEESIHYQTIVNMDNDKSVTYMLNDIQGRIRDMMKNIYGIFLEVHHSGVKIHSSSSVVEHDGVEILKDKTHNLIAYRRYVLSIIADRHSFIKEELLLVIEKIMGTMPPRLFRETLEWISSNFRDQDASVIEEVISEMMIFSFDYLSHERAAVKNSADLPLLMTTLRGVIMSSRSTDPVLFQLREKMEKIIVLATNNKNTSAIASVRTGVLLYIVLRAFTMRHYTHKV